VRPPQLGDPQVNCGPDWPNECAPDGNVQSIKTPLGEYDLAAVAGRLPPGQRPELVVCLVDSSWRNVPRNLGGFKCPRVLLVADTHHLTSPIIGMLQYVSSEPYDQIVFLYDRHHASLFHSVGFRNLHWFPGLTFPHSDAAVKAARKADGRLSRIAFVGPSGKFYPRHTRLLNALRDRRLPIEQQDLQPAEALGFYGSSLAGFNASLDGGLNLRVFEILAAGGTLLTDRLAPESGLERLLCDGRDVLTYGSPDELAEKAGYAIAHTAESKAIGLAGAEWFDVHLGEARRREAFQALAFDGTTVPEFAFSAEEKTRIFFNRDTDQLVQTVLAYEKVQELHRDQETVQIALDASVPEDVSAILSTLPRVQLGHGTGLDEPDLAVFGLPAETVPNARRLWCWNAPKEEAAKLEGLLAGQGFERTGPDVALFSRKSQVPADTRVAALGQRAQSTSSTVAGPAPSGLSETPPAGAAVSISAASAEITLPLGPLPGIRPVRRKICITFGGEVYDGTTALAVLLAPKFGADEYWVYDDYWLVTERRDFYEQNRWLWDHHHKRGFGWYAWKPFILLDAFDRMNDGDVVLYTDADTFPVDNFSVLYETCAKDGGIMLFKAGGNVNRRFTQGQWCKRDCFIVMNQDEPKYHAAEAGVARFMLFQKGSWRARQFLMEWLTYCVNTLATTFDPSVLAGEVAGFVEHRTEQAIMTNLAHKYGLRLYREACELGNSFPEDKDLYPQLFSQLNPWDNKTAPCQGSRFRVRATQADAPVARFSDQELNLACGVAKHRAAMGRTAAAKVILDAVLEQRPDFFPAHLLSGLLAERAGDLPKAVACYEIATALNPGHAVAFTRRSLIKLRSAFGAPSCVRGRDKARPFVTMSQLGANGRFGNQILQYGLLRLYAAKTGAQPLVPDWIGRDLFGLDDALPNGETVTAALDEETVLKILTRNAPAQPNVDLRGYFCGDTSAWAVGRTEFLKWFQPAGRVKKAADTALRDLMQRGNKIVALHVRRGDFGAGRYWLAPSAWYRDWLAHVAAELSNSVIYVASDDPAIAGEFAEWHVVTAAQLGKPIPGAEFFVDHWVLRHADWLATSNSTFSVTAALLNGKRGRCFRPDRAVDGLREFDPWTEKVLLD
jgi:Glycosyl transferases group 1